MNSRDWFRKTLKFRVQHALHQPTRFPRLRRALVAAVERVWAPPAPPPAPPPDDPPR